MNKIEKIIIGLFIILIIGFLVIVYLSKGKEEDNNKLKIHFFNAGKADAIIISKNNKYIMIDTGEENLSDEILNYFSDNNITRLEYLIITHFDKDHVGSASKIIDKIEIGEVLQSNFIKDSTYYDNYVESLKNKNITPKTVSGDYKIEFETLDVTVNGPTIIYDNNESNNSSLITMIKYDEKKFIFMGDTENARIKDFLKINTETFDFLKVPYHGHYQKRLDDIITEKQINTAVITSSDEEKEDEETLEILKNNNVKYYLTRKGAIDVLSDGKEITVKQ